MKIIIAGASAIGSHLARLLSRSNQDIVLIDENADKLGDISSNYDLMTLVGEATNPKTLRSAGVPSANLFIAVTPDENVNISCCVMAHTMGAQKTVAQIDRPEYMTNENKALFKRMGIDELIYPEMLAARDVVNGLKMSWVRQRWDVHDGSLVMLGIKLRENAEILNQPLRQLCGPQDPYHVVAIKRNGDARDLNLLTDENIRNTQGFVALTGNAEANILACLTAKKLGVRKTIAMVENTNYASMAESLDIGTVINKKVLAAGNIYQMMLDADVQNIRFLMSANADVAEFTAQRGSKVTRKKVYELGLPKGMTIGGLVRGKEGMLVSGGTQIEAGDAVVVICHDVNMKNIEKFFTS